MTHTIDLSSSPKQTLTLRGVGGLVLPAGFNNSRPSEATVGTIRWNYNSRTMEFFNGSEWGQYAALTDGRLQVEDPTEAKDPVNLQSMQQYVGTQLPFTRSSRFTKGQHEFVVPKDVYSVFARAWGAGGGGGASLSDVIAASGAGGGGYSDSVFAVKPGDILVITVGAGGVAGLAIDSSPGGYGDASHVALKDKPDAHLVFADGGLGTETVLADTAASDDPGAGGTRLEGRGLRVPGCPGSWGIQLNETTHAGGVGGFAFGGGNRGLSLSTTALDGFYPGGGGSGARNAIEGAGSNGGAGADGVVVLQY